MKTNNYNNKKETMSQIKKRKKHLYRFPITDLYIYFETRTHKY